MTLRGLVYVKVGVYLYGRFAPSGPPIFKPRSDVQTGWGAKSMTVTLSPYLDTLVSWASQSVPNRSSLPIFLDSDVLASRQIQQGYQVGDGRQDLCVNVSA